MKRLILSKRPEMYAFGGFITSKSNIELLIIKKIAKPPVENYLLPQGKRKVCGKTWRELE